MSKLLDQFEGKQVMLEIGRGMGVEGKFLEHDDDLILVETIIPDKENAGTGRIVKVATNKKIIASISCRSDISIPLPPDMISLATKETAKHEASK